MMKKTRRVFAGFLAAAVLGSAAPVSAGAAAPAASADETVYANLDYYGRPEKIDVVKGYSLNGTTKITDYGTYQGVLNMSNDVKPVVSGGAVTWNLPQGTQNFYYQATVGKKDIPVPWAFDVSYKLNGVPTDAGKLAGVSGLVEIDIKATPNKSVSSYLKNNMFLEVGTAFKMKDTLSVEAPGSQLQSLGEYKAVIFTALPGETGEYVVRVGTKKFDTVGIVMMMEPGTLNDFKDIKDIKESKDRVKDSLDAINDGTDSILDTLTGMTGGLSGIESGLDAADAARGYLSQNKGGVYRDADAAIASLPAVSQKLSALVPRMKEGENAVQDVNTDINDLNRTIAGTSNTLYSLSGHIGSLRDNISDLRDTLTSLDDETEDAEDTVGKLRSELKDEADDIKADKAGLQSLVSALNGRVSNLQAAITVLNTQFKTILAYAAATELTNEGIQNLASILKNLSAELDTVNTDLTDLIETGKSASTTLSQLSGESTDLLDSSADVLKEAEDYLDILHDGHDSADRLLKNASQLGGDLQSMLDACQSMITEINTMTGTANKYKDGAVGTLKDAEALTGSLSSGIDSTGGFLTSLESLMKNSGAKLDDASKKALSGSIAVLRKSLEGIGKTDTIRKAGDEINKTVDSEIDKYEKDNNVLNLDYAAKPVSFTSAKNPTPSSIQIVMRTQEITTEDNSQNIKDQEKADSYVSPLARIRNIFVKIWDALKSVFA